MLLLTGITGGQVWGSKELTFEEWEKSNDSKALRFKKQIVKQQEEIAADELKIKELNELIKQKDVFCQTEDYKKLVEIEKLLQQYKDNEQYEENASSQYLEEKPRKINELKEQLKKLSKTVEQRTELGTKIQQYQAGNASGTGIIGINYYIGERSKNLKIKTDALTQLQKDQKQYFENEEEEKKIEAMYCNSILYSFISGLLSSVKIGSDLANKSFFGTIKNNWKLCGLGAAVSSLTTGYYYKELLALQENSRQYIPHKKLIIKTSLFCHGLGIVAGVVAGVVTGYGVKKLKAFSCYR